MKWLTWLVFAIAGCATTPHREAPAGPVMVLRASPADPPPRSEACQRVIDDAEARCRVGDSLCSAARSLAESCQ
jgi:hypothetical protein